MIAKARTWHWIAWGGLALLSILYLWELLAELGREPGAWEALPFHIGLVAALVFAAAVALEAALEKWLDRSALHGAERKVLFWTPRAAAILFALFLGIFALDVFGEGLDPWQIALALLLHLVPSLLLLAGALLAWRWEWIGALVLMGWALFYCLSARGFPLSVYVEIALLPFLLGFLFLLNWLWRAELRARGV